MSLSQAPLSTPVVDRAGRLDPSWNKYFLLASSHLERATTPKRIVALDNPAETLVWVDANPMLYYTYTGRGGCTFSLNGTKLEIPATTESRTINSFVINAGDI